MKRAGFITIMAAAMAIVAVACEDEPRVCYGGDIVQCACDDGRSGYAACNSEAAFGACDCDHGVPGVDASAFDAADEGGHPPPAKIPLYQPCGEDAQCESGLCYPFNAKGPHCSKACGSADDCPSPSPGCSGKGICKTS